MSEQCGSEVEVEISVSGRFIRASWAGPAESPEAEVVFLNDARCNYGHELSDAEQESLRETATEDFLAEFADAAEDVA